MAVVPAFGWRFLRQWWNLPPLMSYSAPSGFTANTIQISRVSTIFVILGSVPYPSTSQWRMWSVISRPMCSSEWWRPS